jgi:hypothetical protein
MMLRFVSARLSLSFLMTIKAGRGLPQPSHIFLAIFTRHPRVM